MDDNYRVGDSRRALARYKAIALIQAGDLAAVRRAYDNRTKSRPLIEVKCLGEHIGTAHNFRDHVDCLLCDVVLPDGQEIHHVVVRHKDRQRPA